MIWFTFSRRFQIIIIPHHFPSNKLKRKKMYKKMKHSVSFNSEGKINGMYMVWGRPNIIIIMTANCFLKFKFTYQLKRQFVKQKHFDDCFLLWQPERELLVHQQVTGLIRERMMQRNQRYVDHCLYCFGLLQLKKYFRTKSEKKELS